MKKVILMLAVLASMVCMAKNKGSNGHNSNNVEPWDGNTSAYTYESGVFSIKQDGDLLLKLYQPASKNGQVVADFGYYWLSGDSKGKELTLITKYTGNGKPVLEGNSTYTVSGLKEGDKIGFYVEYEDSVKVYSEETHNAGGTDLFFPLTNDKKDVDYYTFGMDNETWDAGGVLAFSFEGIKVTQDEGTTGQPLPSASATMLMAGLVALCVLALRHMRKCNI